MREGVGGRGEGGRGREGEGGKGEGGRGRKREEGAEKERQIIVDQHD